MVMVLNSAYTGPLARASLALGRASMFGGVNLLSSSARFAGPRASGTHGRCREQDHEAAGPKLTHPKPLVFFHVSHTINPSVSVSYNCRGAGIKDRK